MDTSCVAKCNSEAVGDIIQYMKYLVHTLIQEMFWKGNSHNKEGVLEHPVAFCTGGFGPMFLADFTAATLVKAQLTFKLSCTATRPCVHYKKGVVFVVEENAV